MRAGSIYSPPEQGKRNPVAAGDGEKRERREGGEGEPLWGEETATWGGKEVGGEVGEEYRLVRELESRERK